MQFELKRLSRDAIEGALQKAERYRLINEPLQAESICLDILEADPENPRARISLLLALTDQFSSRLGEAYSAALDVLHRLPDEYARAYYEGLISERRAHAHYNHGGPGAGATAFDWLRKAMALYETAEKLRPPGNDDAVLRWNSCARLLMRHPDLEPEAESTGEPALE